MERCVPFGDGLGVITSGWGRQFGDFMAGGQTWGRILSIFHSEIHCGDRDKMIPSWWKGDAMTDKELTGLDERVGEVLNLKASC